MEAEYDALSGWVTFDPAAEAPPEPEVVPAFLVTPKGRRRKDVTDGDGG